MDFCVHATIEVEQVGNGLAIRTPVPIQLVRQQGKWQGVCEKPAVLTEWFDHLEEALVAAAQAVGTELQAAVTERPRVLHKIMPTQMVNMM